MKNQSSEPSRYYHDTDVCYSQSEMTKKYVPLSIKSKRHYKITVCLVSQGLTSVFFYLGHNVFAAGCNFSIWMEFLEKVSAALFMSVLSVGDDGASSTCGVQLCYLLPISFCLRNWMLVLLSANSGYCSTGKT